MVKLIILPKNEAKILWRNGLQTMIYLFLSQNTKHSFKLKPYLGIIRLVKDFLMEWINQASSFLSLSNSYPFSFNNVTPPSESISNVLLLLNSWIMISSTSFSHFLRPMFHSSYGWILIAWTSTLYPPLLILHPANSNVSSEKVIIVPSISGRSS